MQRGGCHPIDGCQDGDGFRGADFTYLAANMVRQAHRPADPAADRHQDRRRRAGRLRRHDPGGHARASSTRPASQNVDFTDEVETANKWGGLLSLLGVKAQVLLLHEGGAQAAPRRAGVVRLRRLHRRRSSPIVAGPATRSSAWSSPATRTASTRARCRTRRAHVGRHQRRQQRPAGHRHRLHAGPPHRQVRRRSRRTT